MQKILKQVVVFILISISFSHTPVGRVQTNDNQPRLYVRIIDNTFQTENAQILNDIFDEFQARLKQQGISATKIIASAFERPFWHLNLTMSQHNTSTIFSVSGNRFQNPFLNISSLLADNYGLDITIEFTSTNRQTAFASAVDLATAIGLSTYRRCQQANSIFQKFIDELEPDAGQAATVNYNLGSSYFYQAGCAIFEEDFHNAVALLEKGLSYYEWSELSVPYATYLAWTYLKAGQEDDGIGLIESLVENAKIIPGNNDQYLNALMSSAQINALASRYNEAIADLGIAIELMPAASLYLQRGQMYLAIYEWDKAGDDFDHAIARSPNYAPAYFHRGVLYYSILQTGLTTRDDALADFQRYLELAPNGEFAARAAEYVENIQRELDALNG